MLFKPVCKTINRPHFIAERDREVLFFYFGIEWTSLRWRLVDECSPVLRDSSLYDDDRSLSKSRREDVAYDLNGRVRNVLGATNEKVYYYFDDSARSNTRIMWRIDCKTGITEFTKHPTGFITRFCDSEYFILGWGRDCNQATIYQWKSGDNAEKIRSIDIDTKLNDHRRMAYGAKLMYIKASGDMIKITSQDVITKAVARKRIQIENAGESPIRWLCAKNHLFAIINGRALFINIRTLEYETAPTSLSSSDKCHPFAIESDGFVYALVSSDNDFSTVMRSLDTSMRAEIEQPVVIPKAMKAETRKKQEDNFITLNFKVTYRGQTLLDQPMKMLTTKTLGDVLRRSPEIVQPPNTRLKIFYKNEEVLTFRTPKFFNMRDGEKIYAEFINNAQLVNTNEERTTTPRNAGFFPPEMLNELSINHVRSASPQQSAQKTHNKRMTRNVVCPSSQIIAAPASDSSIHPSTISTSHTKTPESQQESHDALLRTIRSTKHEAWINEKLLIEIQWLRNYIDGKVVENNRGQENDELEQLKKKYARALMMMGSSELRKK